MKYLLAGLLAAASATASAAPIVSGEAQVQWRGEPQAQLIVRDTLWRCSGGICRGDLVDHPTVRFRSCLKLARLAGRVTAFRTPAAAFGPEELKRCNRSG